MGIGRIIQDHRPAPTSASEEKAVKQKQDEILKELVPEQPKEKRVYFRVQLSIWKRDDESAWWFNQ